MRGRQFGTILKQRPWARIPLLSHQSCIGVTSNFLSVSRSVVSPTFTPSLSRSSSDFRSVQRFPHCSQARSNTTFLSTKRKCATVLYLSKSQVSSAPCPLACSSWDQSVKRQSVGRPATSFLL